MELGPHAPFIWGSYVLAAAGIGALIAWTIADGRRQRAALAQLEARGVTRRSARDSAGTNDAGRDGA